MRALHASGWLVDRLDLKVGPVGGEGFRQIRYFVAVADSFSVT